MADSRIRKVVIDKSLVENPIVLQSFGRILRNLKVNLKLSESIRENLTEQVLAQLVFSVMNIMESLCGRESTKPRPITKIPFKLFQDNSVGGFLNFLLELLLDQAQKHSVRPSDLFLDSKDPYGILVKIEKEIIKVISIVFINFMPFCRVLNAYFPLFSSFFRTGCCSAPRCS